MRIYVIGAGAMGSLYGALLARAGSDVTLIDTWAEHVEAIRAGGLRLSGITGDIEVDVAALTEPDGEGVADVALIQVDANATTAAAETARRLLKPDGYAVTLQNGIGNLEALSAVLGEGRVMGGLSYHSAAMAGPGHAEHTHAGETWLGELDGRTSERLSELGDVFQAAGFATTLVDDIVGFIWTKFIHNCAINPISAISGLRVGEISSTPAADALQSRIIEEALAVVDAKGIKLVDPDPMASIKDFCTRKFNKPSMLQHMEAGRRTEIEALNAAIVREGRAHDVPTPYNEALSWMIEARQAYEMQTLHGPPIDYEALEAEIEAARKGG